MKGSAGLANKILVLLCVLLLLQSALALNVAIENRNLQKGQILKISGAAKEFVEIRATNEEREVFSYKEFLKDANSFSYEREITFLDPKGTWRIAAKDAEQEFVNDIIVNPTRESEYLVVVFNSPAPTTYLRGTTIEINVKIMDAGSAVLDSMVYFWDVKGQKLKLEGKGDGTYGLPYKIPLDAKLGDWELKITAKKDREGENFGGESAVQMKIDSAPIGIEIVEPKIEEFELGQDIEFKLKLNYPNNEPVTNAVISASANLNIIPFTEEGNGIYIGKFSDIIKEQELLKVEINAKDVYENKGSVQKTLKPVGNWTNLLKENFVFYLFPAIFIFYILSLTFKETNYFFSRSLLRSQKQRLLLLKKNLQREYYQERKIEEGYFSSKNAECDSKLNEIRVKLERIEQQSGKKIVEKEEAK